MSLLLATLVTVAVAQPGPGGQNQKAENLKVLPEDMPLPEVRRVMQGFTRALGVRCLYCHVGEEGKPPSTFDFASDEKEVKEVSRVMMRMVLWLSCSMTDGSCWGCPSSSASALAQIVSTAHWAKACASAANS